MRRDFMASIFGRSIFWWMRRSVQLVHVKRSSFGGLAWAIPFKFPMIDSENVPISRVNVFKPNRAWS
jgi:hypothetical protein